MKFFTRILKSAVYAPMFLLCFGWIALGLRFFDPLIGIILPDWTRLTGIIVMGLGGILGFLCILVFITRGRGTPAPFDPPVLFVASGPYTYVRNPMYIGGFIIWEGFGLYHHSISIIIFSVLLFIVFHLFVVFYEEPVLERQFGKSYTDYKKRTNRWLPKWK